MNREITFRGKSAKGFWVYGNLHIDANVHDPSKNLYYIIRKCFVPSLTMPSSNYIEVDPKTVGQYTGIVDCNGKRIYEGDIVNAHRFSMYDDDHYISGEVRYGEDCGFAIYSPNGDSNYFSETSHFQEPCIEVIGHILDNPTNS